MSEQPKAERILVNVDNGELVPLSKLKEYCEKYGEVEQITDQSRTIIWVDLASGEMLTFYELQDYVQTTERLSDVEKKFGIRK